MKKLSRTPIKCKRRWQSFRNWVNYFRIGNSKKVFSFIRDWVNRKLRRHMMRKKQKKGF
ncbi:group II intron maturase-specific domain-containing protein, partial [Mesotoga sp.]|uniref:group II intron maturase-specific domain-containing protein n=1 Tax=Mesotoga sp. TaxID=2053577 RepID=UPI00345E79E4